MIGGDKIIEIFNQNEWRPICQEGIDELEAKALCRQMFPSFKENYSIQVNQNCQQSTVYIENSLTSIEGHYGIDMTGSADNQFKKQKCKKKETFKDCLDRQGWNWNESDCQNDMCFSLDCFPQNSVNSEDVLKYGNPHGKPQPGQLQVNEEQLLFIFTGQFWDPICSIGFTFTLGNSYCQLNQQGDCQYFQKAKCKLQPKNQGYRDTNFQTIDIISKDSDKYTFTPKQNCINDDLPCLNIICKGNKKSFSSIVIISGIIVALILLVGAGIVLQKRKFEQNKLKKQKEQKKNSRSNISQKGSLANLSNSKLNYSKNNIELVRQQQQISNSGTIQSPGKYNKNCSKSPISQVQNYSKRASQLSPIVVTSKGSKPKIQMVQHQQIQVQQPPLNQYHRASLAVTGGPATAMGADYFNYAQSPAKIGSPGLYSIPDVNNYHGEQEQYQQSMQNISHQQQILQQQIVLAQNQLQNIHLQNQLKQAQQQIIQNQYEQQQIISPQQLQHPQQQEMLTPQGITPSNLENIKQQSEDEVNISGDNYTPRKTNGQYATQTHDNQINQK